MTSYKKGLKKQIEELVFAKNFFVRGSDYIIIKVCGKIKNDVNVPSIIKGLKAYVAPLAVYFFKVEGKKSYNSLVFLPVKSNIEEYDNINIINHVSIISSIYAKYSVANAECSIFYSTNLNEIIAYVAINITDNFMCFLKSVDNNIKEIPLKTELEQILSKHDFSDDQQYGIFYRDKSEKSYSYSSAESAIKFIYK